ncbi:hypothetical protein IWZ01DRAFT_71955 [Phyllosticta capitalensis]
MHDAGRQAGKNTRRDWWTTSNSDSPVAALLVSRPARRDARCAAAKSCGRRDSKRSTNNCVTLSAAMPCPLPSTCTYIQSTQRFCLIGPGKAPVSNLWSLESRPTRPRPSIKSNRGRCSRWLHTTKRTRHGNGETSHEEPVWLFVLDVRDGTSSIISRSANSTPDDSSSRSTHQTYVAVNADRSCFPNRLTQSHRESIKPAQPATGLTRRSIDSRVPPQQVHLTGSSLLADDDDDDDDDDDATDQHQCKSCDYQ